jgi:transposase
MGWVGVTAKDNRLFVEAVLYRCRTGVPWRDLPEHFGDWKNIHRRYSRWAKSGVWKRVFRHLASDADHEYAMLDSTVVRAHQHSAGAQKKTATTRPLDARNPLNFHLTGGAAHDLVGADHLLPDMQADMLIADKILCRRSSPGSSVQHGRVLNGGFGLCWMGIRMGLRRPAKRQS